MPSRGWIFEVKRWKRSRISAGRLVPPLMTHAAIRRIPGGDQGGEEPAHAVAPDRHGVAEPLVCDEMIDESGERAVDAVIHPQTVEEPCFTLPGAVDQEYRDSALNEVGGPDVVLLPPPVESAHHDHRRWPVGPRGAQEPSAERS